MERRELHTLRFWRFVRILPDNFSLRRFLANVSVCHELLDLFFVISEPISSRKGKVVINKSASFFFDKRRSCRIAFFSILYSWQWPHKGLTQRQLHLFMSLLRGFNAPKSCRSPGFQAKFFCWES